MDCAPSVIRDWLIRAALALCLLAPMALAAKVYLIEPNSVIDLDLEIELTVDRTLKGDRGI